MKKLFSLVTVLALSVWTFGCAPEPGPPPADPGAPADPMDDPGYEEAPIDEAPPEAGSEIGDPAIDEPAEDPAID